MEEQNHKEYYRHRHGWQWVAGILIVLAAFGIGFMCGRFSALFGAYGYGYGYGYPMMGPWMRGGYAYPYPYDGYGSAAPQAFPPDATSTPAPYDYPMYGMMDGYYYPQTTSTQ
jgi:hypothetical protein